MRCIYHIMQSQIVYFLFLGTYYRYWRLEYVVLLKVFLLKKGKRQQTYFMCIKINLSRLTRHGCTATSIFFVCNRSASWWKRFKRTIYFYYSKAQPFCHKHYIKEFLWCSGNFYQHFSNLTKTPPMFMEKLLKRTPGGRIGLAA